MPGQFEFQIRNPGPRPRFSTVAEHLWGPGVDFDSDGNSRTPDDREWTELTVTRRPMEAERVDVDPVSVMPLTLKVVSASRDLALRAAQFLATATGGTLAAMTMLPRGMDAACPEFDQAVVKFQAFLAAHGWPSTVLWLRPSDAELRRKRIVVRPAPPSVGQAHARGIYSDAGSARLGVMLEGICHVDDCTFARVVRPRDADASERGLYPDGLKLAVVTSAPPATLGRLWKWPWSVAGTPWPPHDPDLRW
jgi:hypothetical protein